MFVFSAASGMLLAFGASLMAFGKDAASKVLSDSVNPLVSTFASFAFAVPGYLLVVTSAWAMGYETFEFSGVFWKYVLARTVVDCFAEGLKMWALSKGEISLIGNFQSTAPLWLMLFSPFINKESIPALGYIGLLVVVAGAMIAAIERPENGWRAHYSGIALALASAMFFALNNCFDREAVKNASPELSGLLMTILPAIYLVPFLLFVKKQTSQLRTEVKGFSFRGVVEVAFMELKLHAMHFLPPHYVMGILQLSRLKLIIWGGKWRKERSFKRRLCAGALISCGVVIILFAMQIK